jgi:Prokaryotic Ubiquitin
MEIDQVRELLTPSYPEIATATMTGPEDTGTALRYTFSRAIGSKGGREVPCLEWQGLPAAPAGVARE